MEADELVFLNPYREIEKTANKLPHWQQPGACYFITFGLADAVPVALREKWDMERERWLLVHPQPWSLRDELEYHECFSRQTERWLDAGHGECLLREFGMRRVMAECLRHFEGRRYSHHAWVIMPNHVHVLVTIHDGHALETVMHTWKSFTAHQINQRLGRTGKLWQEDYFDRLIRDAEHFANCARYIARNPEKAGLSAGEFTLHETELAKRWRSRR